MKIFTLIFASLFLITFSSFAEENFFSTKNAYIQPEGVGCTIKGSDKLFPVGFRKQMNHVELKEYRKITGFNASDGYAVMMICLYIVDPLSFDHPKVDARRYVWVAS